MWIWVKDHKQSVGPVTIQGKYNQENKHTYTGYGKSCSTAHYSEGT